MQFIFFLLFAVAVLICGAIKIGPLSIRVYMTVIMLIYLLVANRPLLEKRYRIRRDYIGIFLVCVVALGFALVVNGGVIEFAFFEKCLAYYLVCIVAYFAVDYFVKNESHFDKLVFVICLILLLDTTATILQYFQNPIGWGLAAIFADMETVNEFVGYFDRHEVGAGVSMYPGIIGLPVPNGFILSVATPMLLTGFTSKKPKLIVFLYSITIISVLFALFVLQQRAAFAITVLVVAYHFLRSSMKHPGRFLIPIVAIILIVYNMMPSSIGGVSIMEMTGGLIDTENSVREGNWRIAFDIILRNPLFGNYIEYVQTTDLSSHNVLIDTLIDAGIFGFIPMCYLCIKTIIDSSRIMLKANDDYSKAFSYSVLSSMGMGMLHNTSYLTGHVIIFLSLALMFKSQAFSQRKILTGRLK